MAAYEEGNDGRFRITYFRRRRFRNRPLPLTPPRTPEIIPHKPIMIDDDSEEDIEKEEKFYLEEEVDSKEKKAHAEESENMFEKIKPKMTEDDSEEDKQREEKVSLKKKKLKGRKKKANA